MAHTSLRTNSFFHRSQVTDPSSLTSVEGTKLTPANDPFNSRKSGLRTADGHALSQDQSQAILKASNWFKNFDGDRSARYFTIRGLAGTGKTSLIPAMLDAFNLDPSSVAFIAFTGKAAHVLAKKGFTAATTIHNYIYWPNNKLEATDYKKVDTPHFKLKEPHERTPANLVCVDEGSMVNDEIAKHLLSTKTPVLVLMDHGQLGPVEGVCGFNHTCDEYNAELRQIHRQAADNPIIAAAHAIRNRQHNLMDLKRYADEDRLIVLRNMESAYKEYLSQVDQTIVAKNDTRIKINNFFLQGRNLPCEGDKIICTRNNPWINAYNGSTYMVKKICADDKRSRTFEAILCDEDGNEYQLEIWKRIFEVETDRKLSYRNMPSRINELRKSDRAASGGRYVMEATYGWAITGHKSQASQWDSVLIIDDHWGKNVMEYQGSEYGRWRYTTLTRACKRAIIAM